VRASLASLETTAPPQVDSKKNGGSTDD